MQTRTDIQIAPLTPDTARRQRILQLDLGFGRYFTDRMFTIRYEEERGWHDGLIGPFEDFHLSPAAAVLHYGQSIFEGQKAFRRVDDEIGLFRPGMNAERFRRSAARMVMPEVPEELYVDALETLVDLERDWTPGGEMQALYVRPFMFATEPLQGVRAANRYVFTIILSPVGAYYASGFKPVKILVSETYVRAVPGGTGEAKCAGNYAASLMAGREARESGCSQVLWLDGSERRYVEEIGAMNVMFVIDGKVVTPPLGGSILPGITRDTILQLCRHEGIAHEERRLAIDEVVDAIADGRCSEAFGCGTAAVITSISAFLYRGREHVLPQAPGPFAERFLKTITDIQWGRITDKYGWVHIVPRRDG